MGNKRIDIDIRKEELINLYNNKSSIRKIARLFNCDCDVIKRILRENNIEVKPGRFYMKGRLSEKKGKTYEELYGERANEMKFLVSKRTKEGMDKPELRKFLSDRLKGKKLYKMTNEIKIKLSNSKLGPKNPMFGKFGNKHHNFGKNIQTEESKQKIKLAHLGTKQKPETIEKRKNNLNNIKTQFKEKELHPFWNNGSSFEPYGLDFNRKFKKFIRERDCGCLLCNLSFEDLRLLKRKTNIHHIDYNKLNTLPQNCCVLCNSCHSKTNFNRLHWIKFFHSLLAERYGYKYSEDGKIILKIGEIKNE